MDFVGRESGGDLGGRANAGGIHQKLAPEEAEEIGKGKRAGFLGGWQPSNNGQDREQQNK